MNSEKNNRKIHFKMYKSGKQWVIAGLTTAVAAVAIYSGTTVFNDSVVAKADAVATSAQSSNADTNQSSAASASSNSATPSSTSSAAASVTVETTSNADAQGIQSLPEGGNYTSSDNGQTWKYSYQNNDVKGLYQENNNIRYFSENDGSQVKGNIVNVNNKNYYFDSNNGDGHLIKDYSGGNYVEQSQDKWTYKTSDNNLVKGIATIDGQIKYYDPTTGIQLKGGSFEIGGAAYYVDPAQGNVVGRVNTIINSGNYVNKNNNTTFVDDNNNTVKGLNVVKGNLQYFNSTTGYQAKSEQVVANGATYYFDKDGNGTFLFNNTGSFSVTDFAKHNVANSNQPSDFTNTVDGFLTAETWYRPKQILDNGTKWRNSNKDDLRPLITVWWPNKDVQVNYLQLMQDNGLLDNSVKYTVFSDQQTLNEAAQSAQVNIEKRITQQKASSWLYDLLFKGDSSHPSFMNQQYIWNMGSESQWQGDAWFQGGYLKYGNSPLTPTTNSKYRKTDNQFDFLLANDVDNSNPAVQAEDINWLYYLTHFGTITGKNDKANFDSIRLDAVDFVSNEIIERSNDYLRDLYKLTKSDANADKHISLVEAGVDAGTSSTNGDSLVEAPFRLSAYGLLHNSGKVDALQDLVKEVDSGVLISDHSKNSKDGGVPNYSIVHAHDKDVQERVGQAIVDSTGIKDWTNFTPAQLAKGLSVYYADQRKTVKKYNDYNMPSAYAIMLTNKGTVPRIYYGDMYQDDGQFMQKKSFYYDDIVKLMTARLKYVAGGQTMSVDSNGFLKSVRFGKGAKTVNSKGTKETRHEGIGLIVGNDAKKVLSNGQKVTLNMGAAHKNQKYRALMLTTNKGVQTFASDKNAPVVKTDGNGVLTFTNKDIKGQANTSVRGVLNPKVSGYLAVWVPVGAKDNQNARTQPSKKNRNDGKVLHSNDALDSNLIYEGFSNFQPQPKKRSQYANVVIAKNAKLFKKWGITSFEMAPQYRSSNDKTFVDSTINNGYAFSDRYDLGFGKPTKYGTDKDLRKAIESLHDQGMQVMADAVLNQLYNLPGKQVVSAQRAGVTGNIADLPFGKQLYVVNTIGGGKYQKKYGGKFLKALKAKYPSIFKGKTYKYNYKNYSPTGEGYLTLNTGKTVSIPSNQPITEWSAKYMNGTNILGRGMGYVLKDWNTGTYFKLNGLKTVLPSELTDKSNWVNEVSTSSKDVYNKSVSNLKDAKKKLAAKKSKENTQLYNNALNSYYKAEKEYLSSAKLYNKKYYYDFDKLPSKVKVAKVTYSYKSIGFSKDNRIKKLKKGTVLNVKGLVLNGKVTRINIGNGKFVTASKDFIKAIR